MVGLTSASGLVGFLSEPDPELKVFALKTLDAEVDVLWTDIVDAIPEMYVCTLYFYFFYLFVCAPIWR
jgi:26S proteasome regulatory subunit N2